MASTGQALIQAVQPMHTFSSMTAKTFGASVFNKSAGSSTGTCSKFAKAAMVFRPPGGHKLIADSCFNSASA